MTDFATFFTDSPKATLSKTDRCSNSAYDWNTKPTSRRRICFHVTSSSPNRMRPLSGASMPAMVRKSVVLPEPDGPNNAVSWPGWKRIDTSSSAWWLPKRLATPETSMATRAAVAAAAFSTPTKLLVAIWFEVKVVLAV